MSFGECVFSAGFIQKTVKGDLFVKGNYGIPPCKQRGKILEDSKRLSTEAYPEGLQCGASRLHLQASRLIGPTGQPLIQMLVPHRLLGCLSAVISSRFNPKAED